MLDDGNRTDITTATVSSPLTTLKNGSPCKRENRSSKTNKQYYTYWNHDGEENENTNNRWKRKNESKTEILHNHSFCAWFRIYSNTYTCICDALDDGNACELLISYFPLPPFSILISFHFLPLSVIFEVRPIGSRSLSLFLGCCCFCFVSWRKLTWRQIIFFRALRPQNI